VGSEADPPADLPPAILVMGPTAAGKTEVALKLAERLPVGLISVDSAQIYRGLDIGSAKPEPACLARHPHALIDIRDPRQTYSVAEFIRDCREAMLRLAGEGRVPLLVGGTMMYFRALLYGLDKMPPADPVLRRQIEHEAERRGWESLHRELAQADPGCAARIEPGDRQRIARGLEILRATGRGPSDWRRHNRIPVLKSLRLVLAPSCRHILHQRIERRFDQMMEQGFLEEMRTLRKLDGLNAGCSAIRSVGYRQAWAMMDGEFGSDQLPARVRAATRQLAKRQLTALRGLSRTLWYDPGLNGTINRVLRRVEAFCGVSTDSSGSVAESGAAPSDARLSNGRSIKNTRQSQ